MKQLAIIGILLLAGCDALPRDPGDTSKRIAATGRFSVGLVDPALRRNGYVAALVRRIEQQTGARAEFRPVSGETLLTQIKAGAIDLAFGRFSRKTPWVSEVTLGPPLESSGREEPIETRTAMRNGENRWIMTVERASRAVSATARAE